MDIEKEAQRLEQEIKSGQIEAVSEELRNMSPDDRKAVAQQIEKDQQQKPADQIPPVDFYDSGELKSVDTNLDETTQIHTEYDKATGKRKSEDFTSKDGSSSHWEYDLRTGNSVSGTYHRVDGSTDHSELDRKTMKVWTVESDGNGRVIYTRGTDGRMRNFHYDEEGKVDQIDGHLGHWDRVDQNGQTAWVNRDTKAVWEGDFSIDANGNVNYKPRQGTAWTFTRDGKDVRR